ncbi:hypothetical protein N7453_009745 [Penicillium expansum]|nr:hypothetical protein N7453_009745 [Penicillium expansum]
MGRKDFLAKRGEIAETKRRLQREKNGYIPGAHRQEDSIREKDKRLPKTNTLHREIVNLWLNFIADPENGFEYYKTSLGCPAPSHEMIKEFIRWYTSSIQGRLNEDELPTVRTVSAHAERFFGGFEQFTKTKIVLDDRKEIKMTDHQKFIPGLLKVVILLALQVYLFTGARVGSFVPSSEDKHEKGLRYKDIKLVLFPSSTAPWKVGWKVNQVWLKNNRCPKYTVFGIGIRDSNKPLYSTGDLLLSLALEHGALFSVKTVNDLAQFDLSNGEVPLRWKNEYLEKPVLRDATADGPLETPLTKQKFSSCLRQIFTGAGYFGDLPTIHCMRRNLAMEIEKRHGSAPVSQIMAHKGAGTFPEHYQAHCSSIDTVSAILDEDNESDHIEYFQGYMQFYERGLPSELPAETKESILEKPDMLEMRDRMKIFEQNHDENSLKNEKLEYRKALVRHRLFELKQYQNRWVRKKRDQKIINRGKKEPTHLENDISTRAQMLIMPEVARIATAMSCNKELSFDEKLLFVQDLQTQCARDFDVTYLPNESPTQGEARFQGEAQSSSTKPGDEHTKKIKFHHYSPPFYEREHCVSAESFVPIPALLPSVEENPGQYSGPGICDKYSTSSRNSLVDLCFSETGLTPGSGPTTPDREAIDPRILEPPKFNSDNTRQSCDPVVIQPSSLIFSPEEDEATKMSVSGIKQLQPPALSFASQPSGYCVVPEANENKGLQCLTSSSTCDQAVTAEFEWESHPLTRGEGGEGNLSVDDQAPSSSPRRTLTRSKSPRHHSDRLNSYKPRQRLNAKNKRKLRDLQKQNLTLRQIGPHFADIDMALLRQAWMELKPSQRCTRSRAN